MGHNENSILRGPKKTRELEQNVWRETLAKLQSDNESDSESAHNATFIHHVSVGADLIANARTLSRGCVPCTATLVRRAADKLHQKKAPSCLESVFCCRGACNCAIV